MSGRRGLVALVVLVLTLGIGFWFGKHKSRGVVNDPVLQTYQVNPSRAKEIQSALNHLFYAGEKNPRLGKVQLVNPDVLAVRAPKSLIGGVGQLVDVAGQKEVTDPERMIRLEYWLVVGSKNPKLGRVDRADLQSTLKAIAGASGDVFFKVLSRHKVSSQTTQRVRAMGSLVQLRVNSSAQKNSVFLELDVMAGDFGKLETDLQIASGETLVFGEASLLKGSDRLKKAIKNGVDIPDDDINVYHVIKATLN